jgi:hypothetical protein
MVGYHDLIADLRSQGCPICHGAQRSAWRYLDGLLWEKVNDAGVRFGLRASHGYCREHSMMLLSVASAHVGSHGLAILLEDLLRHVMADAEHEAKAKAKPNSRHRRSLLSAEAPCSVCQMARSTEDSYIKILSKADESSPPFEGIRREGRGICLPHLVMGLSTLSKDVDARVRYVACFRHGSAELALELGEFVRKLDYRFHHERLTPGESSSWRRGVYRMVGEPMPTREPPR